MGASGKIQRQRQRKETTSIFRKGMDKTMRIAVCPGSFDPVTLGHLDVFERACRLFDKVVVGVVQLNSLSAKKYLFTLEERISLVEKVTAARGLENLTVKPFSGLLVDFAAREGASAIVKGLRMMGDYEYELTYAIANRKMQPQVDTVFLPAGEPFLTVSSSAVRELGRYGGDLTPYLPREILEEVKARLGR